MSNLRELLAIRDFRRLWTAQIASDFGDSLTSLSLLILIQRLTGSTLALGGLMVAIALPTLIFGTLSGVYVDRLDRRKTMIVSDSLRAILVLGFVAAQSEEMVLLIYTLAFTQAAVGTLFTPARAAFMPAVVGEQRLLAANSVAQTSRIVFGLLGTGAAGVLASLSTDLSIAFVVDAMTFVVSALLIIRIRTLGRPHQAVRSRVRSDMMEGFRVMASSRPLRAVLISLSVTMLGLGAVNVLFVPLLVDDLKVSEAFFGAIEAGQVAGMVISGAVVAVLATRLRPSTLVSVGLIGVGAFVAAISVVTAVWQLMVVLLLVGLSVGPAQAGASTLSQTLVADSMRGRVGGALNTLVTAANVLSMGLAGVAAAAIGIRNVFLVSGMITAFAGLLAFRLFRGLRTTPVEPTPETV